MHEFLHDCDVDKILEIPVPDTSAEDRIIWSMSKHGDYTVRSAYILLLYDLCEGY